MQPVTMTLPFSFSAVPIAPSDSSRRRIQEAAGVDDDQVGAVVLAGDLRIPSARRRVRMRSESTSAFGQPRLTKLTRGAAMECFLSTLERRRSITVRAVCNH